MKKVHWILAPNWQLYYGSLDGDVLLCSFVFPVMYPGLQDRRETFQLCHKEPSPCRGVRYIDEILSKADKSVFLKLSATYRYRKMKILKLSKNYRYRKMHQI